MRKELDQKVAERWPKWFNVTGDIPKTRMVDGFGNGDGWFEIIWRLCCHLEPLVAEMERSTHCRFEVLQVKEKFGGLRFYVSQHTDAITKGIEAAKIEALHTCEVCGRPGRLQGPSLKTVCDAHADEEKH